jgi:hypothetical protein
MSRVDFLHGMFCVMGYAEGTESCTKDDLSVATTLAFSQNVPKVSEKRPQSVAFFTSENRMQSLHLESAR